MRDLIPLYTADGELHDWISEQRMARLDKLGLIRIVRHKKGKVSRCILHRRPGDPPPTRLSVYLGRRYSYRENSTAAAASGRCASFGREVVRQHSRFRS